MALTQPWLPEHVYPPPAPRHGKINIGYVSGDLKCALCDVTVFRQLTLSAATILWLT